MAKKGEQIDPEQKIDGDSINCSSFTGALAGLANRCLLAVQKMKSAQVDWQESAQERCSVGEKARGCTPQSCSFDEVNRLADEAIAAAEKEKKMAASADEAGKSAKATIAELLKKHSSIIDRLNQEKNQRASRHLAAAPNSVAKSMGAEDEDKALKDQAHYGGSESSRLKDLEKKIRPTGDITGLEMENPISDNDIESSGDLVAQPLKIAKFAGELQNAMRQRQAELEAFKREMEAQKLKAKNRKEGLGEDKGGNERAGGISKSDPTGGGGGGGDQAPPDSQGKGEQAGGGGGGGGDSGGGGGGGDPGGGSDPSSSPEQFSSIESNQPTSTGSPDRLSNEGRSIFGTREGSGESKPLALKNDLTPTEGLASNVSLSEGSSQLESGKKASMGTGRHSSGSSNSNPSSTADTGSSLGSSSSRTPATVKAQSKDSLPETSDGTFDEMGSLGTPEFSLPGSELDEFSQTLAQDLSGGQDALGEELGGGLDFQANEDGITATEGDYALVEMQADFRRVFQKYQANGSLTGPPKRGPSLPH